mmetsp:Transcript_37152/g.76162  ORF Transcript_37152/g.76162 Transcript_37152/m.76162 type:complete len:114 (-) Transcript_37152:226-567(-)|eukprot:CAMPEP_0181326948 /NCGR_PEP_ID=MMETSP1101-20121128/21804_1 /TAXON_ID=46948 /ORGANISM="Rhodomonas abbreviata, Strain Caron Lab Isolate" /LENGTH=113 /DNA_ID=CAMNT_0023435503 /DNA_START=46 /DNA_END=387 /DNA_ORIENTATION=+
MSSDEEPVAKRKRVVEDDEDDEAKQASKGPPKLTKDGDGYWANLGTKSFKNSKTEKRVTVGSFKGNVNVQFREYYEKDGKMLPGKSGLSLSKDQFSMILTLADQIKQAIKDLE